MFLQRKYYPITAPCRVPVGDLQRIRLCGYTLPTRAQERDFDGSNWEVHLMTCGKHSLLLLGMLALALSALRAGAETPAAPVRKRLSLDRGWRFQEGDIPFPVIKGHQPSYNNAKAGQAWGAAAPNFDDSAWKTVDLPHDWAVEQPFDQNANISQGYRARGIGWYRRYAPFASTRTKASSSTIGR
jgi:hypothetical protein